MSISVHEVCVAAAVAGLGIVYAGVLALRRELVTEVWFRCRRIGALATSRPMPSFQAGERSRHPRERSPNFLRMKWRSCPEVVAAATHAASLPVE